MESRLVRNVEIKSGIIEGVMEITSLPS